MRTPRPLPTELAAAPFRVADAERMALPPARLRASDLAHPFHGVRLPAHLGEFADRCRAALLAVPDDAFVCGPSAALLWGAPLDRRWERRIEIDIARPDPERAPRGRGIAGRSLTVGDRELAHRHGIRVTSPSRTWCDLGALLSLADLVAVGDYLVHWRLPLSTRDALRHAVRTSGVRRGIRMLRAALPLIDERSESRRESILRVLLSAAGIRGLSANHEVVIRGRRFRIDLALPDRMVAIEYQGEYHADPAQRRRDMTRRQTLESAGWFVIELNSDDLRDAEELVRRVLQVLARR
ncbi:DUF559 domain-containing protein [Galbitalea sp. SE-J8]|uniref:endonuclease domain-containing protein n=1 Tax=Galbitalea sp. SE-J8 TaxID=3054952 RepID=UPI00259CF6A8|nr:DUF559 domain-containing protein [Galbitalea sp. SE-J8]MDM4763333.1 DUF559 domain-containing protein [Galbitalea sp. SE-J8]